MLLKLIGVAFGAALMVAAVFAWFYSTPVSVDAQSSAGSFTGYAWSDTIGWVSFDGNGYGLSVDTNGVVTGYIWSDNIGWISANSTHLSGCPSTPCEAYINSNGELHGWLKAVSGGSAQSGGWDGFISLSGSGYGPTIQSDGTLNSYAWGDTNIGWLSFSGNGYAVSTDYALEPTAELLVRKVGDEEWQTDITLEPTDEIELGWNQDNTTNTESCHAVPPTRGFSTGGAVSGIDSDIEEPIGNSSHTYRLLCYGEDQETQSEDSVTVSTIGGEGARFCPGTEVDIVPRGSDVELCWELGTNDPEMCSLKAGEVVLQSPVTDPGTFTHRLFGEVTYKIECVGGDGDEMRVNVLPEVQET